MRIRANILAAALVMAPMGVRAADLVVWWQEGAYAQEDEALREVVAAFEQETGKHVELVLYPLPELPDQIAAALEAGRPPDFAFGFWASDHIAEWAFDDRLVDLSEAIGHFSELFDPDQVKEAVLFNATTGQKALYGLPMGQLPHLIHVWKSLLEQAGFKLEDIPREWEAYWSFWCDEVQPAVRRATGRDDIWAVGLPMSLEAADTENAFGEFVTVYEADYVTPEGRLVIDEPHTRQALIKAIDRYTTIYRKGCTPPDSVTWPDSGNNERFLAQAVVMTLNLSLSIPNALKSERPDDYYKNTATIEWPLDLSGEPFAHHTALHFGMVFRDGANTAMAKEFVRFLVGEGWLAHYLDFSGERMLPSMPALLQQPFWLDPSDPHRMAAVMQAAARPPSYSYTAAPGDLAHDEESTAASGELRHDEVFNERIWAKAVHRVAADGISPEQAVDEAIARIKQILSE
jgi:multiple sugar transport system substrate-binding protein